MATTSTSAECDACLLGRASKPGACSFHPTNVSAGTVLVEQGEVASHVVLVKSGLVLVTATGVDGDELSCGVRGAGTLLGLESLREDASPFDAWALDDITVCRLDRDAFARWVGRRDTPLGAVLDYALVEAARRHGERTALAGRSEVRLARFLLAREEAGARGTPLPLQQQHLARMLAMRAETLSRALARLRSAGILDPGPGVRVVDERRLAHLAEAVDLSA